MSIQKVWHAAAIGVVAGLLMAGCATTDTDETAGVSAADTNTIYEQSTARTPVPKCPAGYILQCETKRVGRIRFNSIGKNNIESCSCEVYQGMPTQSPVPGIQ